MTSLLSAIRHLEQQGALALTPVPAQLPIAVELVPPPPILEPPIALEMDELPEVLPRTLQNEAPPTGDIDPYHGIARQLIRSAELAGIRTIGVVGAHADCDCDEVAARLAMAISEVHDSRVLLVAANRASAEAQPRAARVMTAGNVLAGEASWEQAITARVGSLVSHAWLERSSKARHERQALRGLWKVSPERFSFVVVTVGQVDRAGSLTLAASCDVVCLGIPFGRVSRRDGNRMAKDLRKAGAQIAGCVLM
jgi:hypothetical protein